MTEPTPDGIVEIEEAELSQVQGGLIGLLLPAVQKVRDAAARLPTATADTTGVITTGG